MRDSAGRVLATFADALPDSLKGHVGNDTNGGRPSPPAARPSRIPIYHPPAPVHQLPPPEGPDRALAEAANEPPESARKKRKPRLSETTDAQKAEAVRIALELRNEGKTLIEAAAAIKVKLGFEPSPSCLSEWVKAARQGAMKESLGSDIGSVTAQLTEAMDRVRALKRRLRELLGDE